MEARLLRVDSHRNKNLPGSLAVAGSPVNPIPTRPTHGSPSRHDPASDRFSVGMQHLGSFIPSRRVYLAYTSAAAWTQYRPGNHDALTGSGDCGTSKPPSSTMTRLQTFHPGQ